jgi:hypothetical protein
VLVERCQVAQGFQEIHVGGARQPEAGDAPPRGAASEAGVGVTYPWTP